MDGKPLSGGVGYGSKRLAWVCCCCAVPGLVRLGFVWLQPANPKPNSAAAKRKRLFTEMLLVPRSSPSWYAVRIIRVSGRYKKGTRSNRGVTPPKLDRPDRSLSYKAFGCKGLKR